MDTNAQYPFLYGDLTTLKCIESVKCKPYSRTQWHQTHKKWFATVTDSTVNQLVQTFAKWWFADGELEIKTLQQEAAMRKYEVFLCKTVNSHVLIKSRRLRLTKKKKKKKKRSRVEF